jgi:hypothetical protein
VRTPNFFCWHGRVPLFGGGTVNDALRRALAEARLRDTDIATALGRPGAGITFHA